MKHAIENPEVRRTYEEEVLYGEAVETVGALVANAGITQRELARRLDVSEARVSQILAGGVNLTLRSLANIGWALGIRFELDPVPMSAAERIGTPAIDDPPAPEWISRPGSNVRVRFNQRLTPPEPKGHDELIRALVHSANDCSKRDLVLAA